MCNISDDEFDCLNPAVAVLEEYGHTQHSFRYILIREEAQRFARRNHILNVRRYLRELLEGGQCIVTARNKSPDELVRDNTEFEDIEYTVVGPDYSFLLAERPFQLARVWKTDDVTAESIRRLLP